MPSIYDIANEAKVSHTTVARVINNNGSVGIKTRIKVEEVIKKLNFTPSKSASNLAQTGKRNIGIIIPKSGEHEFYELFRAGARKAQNELGEQGINLFFYEYPTKKKSDIKSIVNKIINDKITGLTLLADSPITLSSFPKKIRKTLSVALLEETDDSSIINIGVNQYESGAFATSLFSKSSIKKSTILVFQNTLQDTGLSLITDRINGFLDHVKKFCPHLICEHFKAPLKDTPELLKDYLKNNNDISGIFIPIHNFSSISKLVCDLKKKNQINIVGYDLTTTNIKGLQDGSIDFIIHNQPERVTYEAIIALSNQIGKKPSNRTSYPLTPMPIHKTNLNSLLTYLNNQYKYNIN